MEPHLCSSRFLLKKTKLRPSGKQYGWYLELAINNTEPVGEKLPNPFGLFDVYGNAREWCSDWYAHDYYGASPVDDPHGPATGTQRVLRGGAFAYHLRATRTAARRWFPPGVRTNLVGFRPVRTCP